jgi:hypothetical protein
MRKVKNCKQCPLLDKQEFTCPMGYATRVKEKDLPKEHEDWLVFSEDCDIEFIGEWTEI